MAVAILCLIMIGVWTWRLHQKTCQRDGWAARSLLKTLNLLLPTVKTFVSRLNLPSEFQIPRPGIVYEIFSILQNSLFQKCKKNVILIYVFSNSLLRILALEFLWIHHLRSKVNYIYAKIQQTKDACYMSKVWWLVFFGAGLAILF